MAWNDYETGVSRVNEKEEARKLTVEEERAERGTTMDDTMRLWEVEDAKRAEGAWKVVFAVYSNPKRTKGFY